MYQNTTIKDTSGAWLYQRFSSPIFAYLLRQISVREDAEDLLVEVFLAALERPQFFQLSEPEQQAWLWRVARNKAVDYYRRQRRRPQLPLMKIEENTYTDDNEAPEQMYLQQEEFGVLRQHLQKLPLRQQELLLLRFGHGLTCGEIAQIQQRSEGSVRMLLSRTLKVLRSIYTRK
ncbi:RNA polymerase sigma factor [Tengunoibacter tsumagoiensis]|uniref:RNA polymerase subunit sigma n=1 Tax=Tengunoibacter tsumagoiensis TaxID=2014871 RepID=A0A401ZVM0_9CHLR|nr:RNA polymerase sigma factor [Tengunoibacter tsumagoiensis]GCE10955.1 RNA polymerase subunit sigma [Tengunoibacter tsumagoiensis]